MLTEGIYIT